MGRDVHPRNDDRRCERLDAAIRPPGPTHDLLPRPRVGRARKGWAALFTLDVRTRSEVARYSHRPSTGQPWRSHVRASALCACACPWRKRNPEGVLACEAPGMVRGLQTLIEIGTRGGEDGDVAKEIEAVVVGQWVVVASGVGLEVAGGAIVLEGRLTTANQRWCIT